MIEKILRVSLIFPFGYVTIGLLKIATNESLSNVSEQNAFKQYMLTRFCQYFKGFFYLVSEEN